MTTSHRKALIAALAGSALLLSACGGGGGGGVDTRVDLVPGSDVPTSATTSVGGLIAFMQSLIAQTSETTEPIALGDAVLATSETDEPVSNP